MPRDTYASLLADLIDDALTEEEIRSVVLGRYREVHNQYSAAMSRTELIRRLVDWCDRRGGLAELREHVAELNPVRAAGYADRFANLSDVDVRVRPTSRRPMIVHPLPPAAEFVGRTDDLQALWDFWKREKGGLLCLVALGGSGKTTMTAEFLRQLDESDTERPDMMLIWSFYDNPDAQSFLATAQEYFAPDEPYVGMNPNGGLYQVMRALESGERNLLVLDGLERVQRTQGGAGLLGEILDNTLSQLVRRLAAGLNRTRAIITTRVAVPRIDPWIGRTCWVRDVAALTQDDACDLLERNGVKGDRRELLRLVDIFGAHALTLDHLGGYLRSFHGGSPRRADQLVVPALEAASVQEHRLARVLNGYATSMAEQELALLSRLCVYRYGRTVAALHEVFATSTDPRVAGPLAGLSESDFHRIVRTLAGLHLVLEAGEQRWTVHPAVRDYFYLRFTEAGAVHDAVRKQYAALAVAPGTGLPTSEDNLDGLEELVHHTIRIGRVEDAAQIFVARLGGTEHLGWHLGQYGRCIRMLQEFDDCPDPGGLIWCHRAVGDLAAAERLVAPDDLWWRGMLGCLSGHLAEVADLLANGHDDAVLTVCEVLTGRADVQALHDAPVWTGLPISVADVWLAFDRLAEAEAAIAALVEQIGWRDWWTDEKARIDLTRAEIARRRGDLDSCESLLDKAGQWVMRSGSQEHLCQWHLMQGRLALDLHRFTDAATALRQGAHTAEHCGFGVLHIDLLIESGRLAVANRDQEVAVDRATAALNGLRLDGTPSDRPDEEPSALSLLGSLHPRCRYLPAADRARQLLRQVQDRQS